MVSLERLVADFAQGLQLADKKQPVAINARSKKPFKPGIGPHTEAQTVALVGEELQRISPYSYRDRWHTGVPYPSIPRQRCDLCLGKTPHFQWAIEIKMLRFLGDNGKVNDNILMHILSPYPPHRSALTDCQKLIDSGFSGRKAILIYGFDHDDWLLDPAIDSFETLASKAVMIGDRCAASFDGLVHPIHSHGRVFGWELPS